MPRVRHMSFVLRASGLVLAFALWYGLTTSSICPVHAKDDPTWPVNKRLVGKDGQKSKNISGIACSTTTGFPRSCLVIDDDMQAAQFLTLNDGELEAGDAVRLIHNQDDDGALQLDGEGVAYADEWFYVVGSHGHPRDKSKKLHPVHDAQKIKAQIAASSQVVRLRVRPREGQPLTPGDVTDIQRSPKLREIITANDVLRRYADRRLENNGLTTEGIAVIGKRMFVGFRGPTLENGTAPVLSVSIASIFEGAPPDPVLHILPMGRGRGVRDLAAFRDGLLILAGPTGGEAGPYIVYWWDTSSARVQHLADITAKAGADEDNKPEAILPLDDNESGLRILVLLDGPKEGGPRDLIVPLP
jgi:hypothetical protein